MRQQQFTIASYLFEVNAASAPYFTLIAAALLVADRVSGQWLTRVARLSFGTVFWFLVASYCISAIALLTGAVHVHTRARWFMQIGSAVVRVAQVAIRLIFGLGSQERLWIAVLRRSGRDYLFDFFTVLLALYLLQAVVTEAAQYGGSPARIVIPPIPFWIVLTPGILAMLTPAASARAPQIVSEHPRVTQLLASLFVAGMSGGIVYYRLPGSGWQQSMLATLSGVAMFAVTLVLRQASRTSEVEGQMPEESRMMRDQHVSRSWVARLERPVQSALLVAIGVFAIGALIETFLPTIPLRSPTGPGTPINGVRLIFGLLLTLVFPGWAMTYALYPFRRAFGDPPSARAPLDPLERFVFSVGLSLAVVPLIVYIPSRFAGMIVSAWSIALVIGGFILVCTAVWWWRTVREEGPG